MVQIPGQKISQPGCELRGGQIHVQMGIVRKLQHLFVHGFRDLLAAVSDVDVPESRVSIQELPSLGIHNGCSLPFVYHHQVPVLQGPVLYHRMPHVRAVLRPDLPNIQLMCVRHRLPPF